MNVYKLTYIYIYQLFITYRKYHIIFNITLYIVITYDNIKYSIDTQQNVKIKDE